MARARLIKPGFFTNDELGRLPPLTRMLFAGLWCIADREGRLEDRPRRIKIEVLPYDDCDVDAMLDALQASGFIVRYEAGGLRCIQITGFTRHQSPHIREPNSAIPPPCGPSTGPARDEHGEPPAMHAGPTPDEHRLTRALSDPDPVIDPDPVPGLPPAASAGRSVSQKRDLKDVDPKLVEIMASLGKFKIGVRGTQSERIFACLDDGALPAWFERAAKICAAKGITDVAYLVGILEGWIREGGPPPETKQNGGGWGAAGRDLRVPGGALDPAMEYKPRPREAKP